MNLGACTKTKKTEVVQTFFNYLLLGKDFFSWKEDTFMGKKSISNFKADDACTFWYKMHLLGSCLFDMTRKVITSSILISSFLSYTHYKDQVTYLLIII